MPKFKVCAVWSETAICEVEADTLKEAIDKVESDPDKHAPEHGNYLDDSFQVDEEFTKELNEEVTD